MKQATIRRFTLAHLLSFSLASAAWADHPCSSPLILDLDPEGRRVDTVSKFYGVEFDINADGKRNRIGWTHPESKDALLWLDLNGNRRVDDGTELFGTATRLPNGKLASNGFEALAQYDALERGGNADGAIDPHDAIWPKLQLWTDSSHDGVSQYGEFSTLDDHNVVWIGLDYSEPHRLDGGLNVHAYEGTHLRRVTAFGRTTVERYLITDVIFATYSPFLDEEPHRH